MAECATFGRPIIALLLVQARAAQTQSSSQPAGTDPEPWRNIRFGATLEVYYQYNANRPPDRISLLRAYDTRANTLAIQQVTLVGELAPDVEAGRRYGLRLDLMFGQATETVQGGPANGASAGRIPPHLAGLRSYVFPVGRGLRTDFGKFASSLGYETNDAKDNDPSRGAYLFNFLPFYHEGLRAALPVSEVTLTYMLTNGIQQTEEFNTFKSNHVMAVGRHR